MNRTDERAAADAGCFRCGYPLIGIADDQACPECGLLAGRSRPSGDELLHARPGWLRSSRRGLTLILLGVAWFMVWMAVWPMLLALSFRWPPLQNFGAMLLMPGSRRQSVWFELATLLLRLPQTGWVVGTLLLISGAAGVTRPTGVPAADQKSRWRRRLLLLCSTLPTAALLCWVACFSDHLLLVGGLAHTIRNLAIAVTIACVPLPALLFFHLRDLSESAGVAQLREHCAIVGTGASAAVLVSVGLYLCTLNPAAIGLSENWATRGEGSLVTILALYSVALFFYCWGIYLLVRFRIAFGRAAGRLRQAWAKDDQMHKA